MSYPHPKQPTVRFLNPNEKRTVKHEKSQEVQCVVERGGKRVVVRADEKLTAFLELESGLAERQEATSGSPGAVSPLRLGTAGPLDPTP